MTKKHKFCPNFAIVLTTQEPKTDVNNLWRARCKDWTCAYCAEMNRKMWRRYLTGKLNTLPLSALKWSFSTLTLPDYIHEAESEFDRLFGSIRFIRLQWDKTMKTAKREYGKFEYIRVLESHKSGALHVHLLSSIWFEDAISRPKFHQSPKFNQICEGYEWGFVDNRNITGGTSGAVNYPIKYMSETSVAFHQAVSGAHLRRVQTSRRIGSPKPPQSPTDFIPRYSIHMRDLEIAAWQNRYWWDGQEDRVITADDFSGIDSYPLRGK